MRWFWALVCLATLALGTVAQAKESEGFGGPVYRPHLILAGQGLDPRRITDDGRVLISREGVALYGRKAGQLKELTIRGRRVGDDLVAHDINNSGTVVGFNRLNDRPFVWRNGHLVDPKVVGLLGTATAISPRNDVAGVLSVANVSAGFILFPLVGQGFQFHYGTSLAAINSNRDVAGDIQESDGPHVWAVVSWEQFVGPLGTATAINSTGTIVGSANGLPFMKSKSGPIVTLTNSGVSVTGTANAISDSGIIVGTMETSAGSRAFVNNTSGGNIVDLNDLLPPSSGWVLERAQSVNSKGEILCAGRFNGQSAVCWLQPVRP